jgi:hypothetical protein
VTDDTVSVPMNVPLTFETLGFDGFDDPPHPIVAATTHTHNHRRIASSSRQRRKRDWRPVGRGGSAMGSCTSSASLREDERSEPRRQMRARVLRLAVAPERLGKTKPRRRVSRRRGF